ncbi:glycosyltransferase family 4 protein [Candidatus Sumerlaeota bacterium]|nr:glycosyltransferase family 4 protein [Candidatus Sumerlaeota bacterium]
MALSIALLVKALPLHRPGGQENHTWTLARGLVRGGHRVTVVTTAHPTGEGELQIDGVRIVPLAGTAPGRNSWGFFGRIARWLRVFEGEFDVIHAQGFAALRAKPRLAPLVTTVHGTVWSETPLAKAVRGHLGWGEWIAAMWRYRSRTLMGPLVHRQWRRSHRLICDSEFTRSEVLRRWPDWEPQVDVVPLGIEWLSAPPVRDEDLARRPIRLLSVGRQERVRGLGDLLEALAGLPDPGRCHLTVVGGGPHLRAISRTAERLGLGAVVDLRGRVDDETLAGCWGEADLFVNPEWSQPAFGLVSLEALGQGLPVLGTRTGATPEIVTAEVGWLVEPRRPEALRERLAHLAANPGEISARREACRRRAEEFTVEAMVRGTERVYRKAVGARGD